MIYLFLREKAELLRAPAFREAGAEELRVLCCLAAAPEGMDAAAVAAALEMPAKDAESALSYWRGAGFVARRQAPKPEPAPTAPAPKPVVREDGVIYTAKELADRLERYQLGALMTACQQLLGRELGRVELNTVVYLREQLDVDEEYILMLLSWCAEIGKPSFRYLEKLAISLTDDGVRTEAALEAYVERERVLRSVGGRIRRMFGIGDRAPSTREKEYLRKWLDDFGYDDGIVGIAYDITVNNTGKAAMAYADKLLSAWHLAGCRTKEEVEAEVERERAARFGTAKKPAKPKTDGPKAESFDPEAAWQRALERSYGGKK